MTDFSIFQLKEFTTLVGTMSYSETAHRLNVSTSALTRHIQALESELGGPLFKRTSRLVELTPFGSAFLPHAVMILQDYDTGMRALNQFRADIKNVVNLGVYYSINEYDIDTFIFQFTQKYPEYSSVLTVDDLPGLNKSFMEGVFNIYTAVSFNNPADMKFLTVGSVSVKAVVAENSPLTAYSTIHLEDLDKVPLFLPENNNASRRLVLEAFEKAGVMPNIVYSGRFEQSIPFILTTNGIGLFTFRNDRRMSLAGLRFIDFAPEIRFDYGFGYRENLSPAEKAFIRTAKTIISGENGDDLCDRGRFSVTIWYMKRNSSAMPMKQEQSSDREPSPVTLSHDVGKPLCSFPAFFLFPKK